MILGKKPPLNQPTSPATNQIINVAQLQDKGNKSKKNIVFLLLTTLIIIASIPAALYLVKQRQLVNMEAASSDSPDEPSPTPTAYPSLTPTATPTVFATPSPSPTPILPTPTPSRPATGSASINQLPQSGSSLVLIAILSASFFFLLFGFFLV